MTWLELTAHFAEAPEDWGPAVDILKDFGIENSLQNDRPAHLVACLEQVPGASERANELKTALIAFGAQSVNIKEVPDEDWMSYWKQYFKPQKIGERLVVRPSWEEYELGPGELEVILDPGQAFGTGDHPTTRLCLGLLQEVDVAGKSFADVGCGSGVLSIGAKRLGAELVVGVDIEPVCVEVSRANAKLNSIEAEFLLGNSVTVLDEFSPDYFLVMSNIISATLIKMAPLIAQRVSEGGYWILSGVMNENAPQVLEAATSAGFTLLKQVSEGDWTALLLSKN